MKVLITGIAGSGKSTIIAELHKRGHATLDLDDCGAGIWVNKKTAERAEHHEGLGKEWIEAHRWQADIPKLLALLNSFGKGGDIFVGGKVAKVQMKEINEIFDVIYLLTPDNFRVDERLRTRTTNKVNFAKGDGERKAIIEGRYQFEEICLAFGAIPVKNHGTVDEVVKRILNYPSI